MTLVELLNLIKIETTGKLVEFEVSDADVTTIINDAIRRVRPWYLENFKFETIALRRGSEDTYFFLEADLSSPLHYLECILGTKTNVTDIQAPEFAELSQEELYQISSIDRVPFEDWFTGYTMYLTQKGATENLRPKLEWMQVPPKVYICNVPSGNDKVSVIYAPLPNTIDQMTVGKAIDWVQDWSIAKTKIALARARGKFRAGGLNFETDSSDLLSEANDAIRTLKEELPKLKFNPAIER